MWTFKKIRAARFEKISKNVAHSLWGKHCIFLKLHFFGILFTLSILPLIITYYFTSKCKLITIYFFSTWTSWDFDFTEHNASLRPFFSFLLELLFMQFPSVFEARKISAFFTGLPMSLLIVHNFHTVPFCSKKLPL